MLLETAPDDVVLIQEHRVFHAPTQGRAASPRELGAEAVAKPGARQIQERDRWVDTQEGQKPGTWEPPRPAGERSMQSSAEACRGGHPRQHVRECRFREVDEALHAEVRVFIQREELNPVKRVDNIRALDVQRLDVLQGGCTKPERAQGASTYARVRMRNSEPSGVKTKEAAAGARTTVHYRPGRGGGFHREARRSGGGSSGKSIR